MPPLTMPGPALGPLGFARGGARVAQSKFSLAFVAASSQYVRVSAAPVLAYPLTLSAWVKANSNQIGTICSLDDNVNMIHRLVFVNNHLWASETHSSTDRNADATVSWDGTVWHHVLGVFLSASSRKLYIDGSLAATDATAGGAYDVPTQFNVGAYRSGSQALQGSVDDVVMFATDQSANAAGLAAGTTDPATLTTAGLWRFEEGSGTTANDSSGNSHPGTLTNGPTYSSDVPSALQ